VCPKTVLRLQCGRGQLAELVDNPSTSSTGNRKNGPIASDSDERHALQEQAASSRTDEHETRENRDRSRKKLHRTRRRHRTSWKAATSADTSHGFDALDYRRQHAIARLWDSSGERGSAGFRWVAAVGNPSLASHFGGLWPRRVSLLNRLPAAVKRGRCFRFAVEARRHRTNARVRGIKLSRSRAATRPRLSPAPDLERLGGPSSAQPRADGVSRCGARSAAGRVCGLRVGRVDFLRSTLIVRTVSRAGRQGGSSTTSRGRRSRRPAGGDASPCRPPAGRVLTRSLCAGAASRRALTPTLSRLSGQRAGRTVALRALRRRCGFLQFGGALVSRRTSTFSTNLRRSDGHRRWCSNGVDSEDAADFAWATRTRAAHLGRLRTKATSEADSRGVRRARRRFLDARRNWNAP